VQALLALAGEACTPAISNLPKLFRTHSLAVTEEQKSVHAVEKKITKEKPLESLCTSLRLSLRVRCMQIGYPTYARRGKRD